MICNGKGVFYHLLTTLFCPFSLLLFNLVINSVPHIIDTCSTQRLYGVNAVRNLDVPKIENCNKCFLFTLITYLSTYPFIYSIQPPSTCVKCSPIKYPKTSEYCNSPNRGDVFSLFCPSEAKKL